MSLAGWVERALLTDTLREQLRASSKRLGSLGHDAWGFDAQVHRRALALCKPLTDLYYRTQVLGLEHVPRHGRLLVVANHSGFLPMDGLLLGVALATNPHGARMPRAMIERFFPSVPYIGNLFNALGAVLGDVRNCADMLREEEAVIVFPEGVRGTGKGWQRRYQLQRFGHGFMHLAGQTATPILPVGIAGCEESFPMFGNLAGLAHSLGLPYVPIGLPLLPSRVVISLGEPLHFGDCSHDTEDVVAGRVDIVKQHIHELVQQSLRVRNEHAQS